MYLRIGALSWLGCATTVMLGGEIFELVEFCCSWVVFVFVRFWGGGRVVEWLGGAGCLDYVWGGGYSVSFYWVFRKELGRWVRGLKVWVVEIIYLGVGWEAEHQTWLMHRSAALLQWVFKNLWIWVWGSAVGWRDDASGSECWGCIWL